LKSLGHWVGDIHQPLHVSFKDDRGGNDIKTTGCSPKLHAVWDTCLVDYVVRHDVAKAVTDLMETITPEKRALWISSSPRDWANETFALAKAPATRSLNNGNFDSKHRA
jgi:S1/P1 Nuclease